MARLPRTPRLFNDYHAQIVRLAKELCRPATALRRSCPLEAALSRGADVSDRFR